MKDRVIMGYGKVSIIVTESNKPTTDGCMLGLADMLTVDPPQQ